MIRSGEHRLWEVALAKAQERQLLALIPPSADALAEMMRPLAQAFSTLARAYEEAMRPLVELARDLEREGCS